MSLSPSSRFTGGKGAPGVAERILSAMPEHSLYVEAFAGRATIALRKKPAPLEILVDRDEARASSLRARMPATSTIVVCGDVTRVLEPSRLPPTALVYADPPYLLEVRRSRRRYYRQEFSSEAEHLRLLEWLKACRCYVMLSGYHSDLYAQALLEGWWRTDYRTRTRGATVIESLWQNFPPGSVQLHDTRYVGDGFRERERIKRKVHRWIRRLQQLPHAERAAVLAAFDEQGLTRRK